MGTLLQAIENNEMRICNICGEQKPLGEFRKRSAPKKGFMLRCRECERLVAKKYYQEHVEEYAEYHQKHKEYRADYRQDHSEEIERQHRKYREIHKVEKAETDRRYRKEHKTALTEKKRQYRESNQGKIAAHKKEYYENNKEAIMAKNQKWFNENPEKQRAMRARYVQTHPEQLKETARKSFQKRYSTPKGKLALTVSAGICGSLGSGAKSGRHWETLVNFTIDQLKIHLEKQFRDGMTWDNYGKYGWHIDHIIPISAFNFERPEDIDFKICWSLENLQPLEAKKNISKGCRLDRPFQPSLAMAI